jgi:hypothetical protein
MVLCCPSPSLVQSYLPLLKTQIPLHASTYFPLELSSPSPIILLYHTLNELYSFNGNLYYAYLVYITSSSSQVTWTTALESYHCLIRSSPSNFSCKLHPCNAWFDDDYKNLHKLVHSTLRSHPHKVVVVQKFVGVFLQKREDYSFLLIGKGY